MRNITWTRRPEVLRFAPASHQHTEMEKRRREEKIEPENVRGRRRCAKACNDSDSRRKEKSVNVAVSSGSDLV